MAPGIRALRMVQIGQEVSAGGTTDPASTIWRGEGMLKDNRVTTFPTENIGIIGGVNRTYVGKTGGEIELTGIATYEQLPYIFNAGFYLSAPTTDAGSESIRTWKEVLENRNFIYEQLCNFIQPQLNNQGDQQQNGRSAAGPSGTGNGVSGAGGGLPAGAGPGGQPGAQHVELLDICWNLVKLASVSRKQGLPSLALHYQDAAEKKLSSAAPG